jgi:hypothetical protein
MLYRVNIKRKDGYSEQLTYRAKNILNIIQDMTTDVGPKRRVEDIEEIELLCSDDDFKRFITDTKLKIVELFQNISGVGEIAWDYTDNYNIETIEKEWTIKAALKTIKEASDRIEELLQVVNDLLGGGVMGEKTERVTFDDE